MQNAPAETNLERRYPRRRLGRRRELAPADVTQHDDAGRPLLGRSRRVSPCDRSFSGAEPLGRDFDAGARLKL